ncbi:MAG: phospholipid carrier-dependent glycosyltransferase [Candidatus Andersenbacteria bacterium]|nr:phospholipid carrier-dependent glycosyltransferase [Candidatus Andersenbacteria bacterium]
MRNRPLAAIILAVLTTATLLPRLFDLGAFQTADEKMWVANTQNFTRHLATFNWDHLLQQPHPGITTTWLGSLTINSPSLAVRKLPLVIGQSVLIGLTGYIFYRLWGKTASALLVTLLALNPFLIAHTRVYAMDSLLAHFLLLSTACLLLWREQRETRYLIFAAYAAALAVLSKLPGLIIVAATIVAISFWTTRDRRRANPLAPLAIWLTAFAISLIAFFPSLTLNFPEVKQKTLDFLLTGDVQEVHHVSAGFDYYFKTLIFFSTPLQLGALFALPFTWRYFSRAQKEAAMLLLSTAALFIAAMSFGAKKGDRYILPVFLLLDAAFVLVFFSFTSWLSKKSRILLITSYGLLITMLAWQAADVARLHPYALAYVNPLTKPWYGDRRLGWGEGLDLAAQYLNKMPAADQLTVAAPYPTEFAYVFTGRVIPLNHYAAAKADYIILYRSLLERGHEAWETEVLHEFQRLEPEKTITLNGLPYVWIYRAPITAN